MSGAELRVRDDGPVRVLELCHPAKRNALTIDLLRTLHRTVADAGQDGAIDAIVITGADGAFCAGWDVDEVRRLGPGEPVALSREIQATLRTIETAPVPVVAAVEGPARGGGCGIACAADVRVFGEGATIGVPEVALGTIPGGGIVRRLALLAGHGVAAEMLYTGMAMDAPRAEATGLANRVVGDGSAVEVAVQLARTMTSHAASAVKAAKRVLIATTEATPDRLVDLAALEIETLLGARGQRA